MPCKLCDDLTISDLIELTETEFSAHNFPRDAYYQHHASYADLVSSADDGCEFCELIYKAFLEIVVEGGYWADETLDEAVRGIGSEGFSTDLKVCINTSQLYSGETLDRVKLFDIILVQAGISEPYGRVVDYEAESRDWSVADPLLPLVLELSVPRGRSRFVGNFEVGRYHTDPDLGSAKNLGMARAWLEECCVISGENTQAAQTTKLPTRVLEVGDLSTPQSLRIFQSENTEAKYASLSHCWGGVISPLLTTENLESFRRSIPYDNLPANFCDAIIITRQLGIRYLWIDSLCIMQNSRLDWETESKKMGDIYRDALVTISASTSPGSTHGIFKSKAPPFETVEWVTLRTYKNSISNNSVCVSKKQKTPVDVYHRADGSSLSIQRPPENLYDLFAYSSLSQRGWTLQEDLLSPRVLYYGERQIYWKCPHGFQSADGMPSIDGGAVMPSEDFTFPRITAVLHGHIDAHPNTSMPSLESILEDYYWLVRTYASRRLTFESDRLPALSGIVKLLQPIIGGEYLAGLWGNDLARGLSWFFDIGVCKHVSSYRAPSWAWAVTDDPVIFISSKIEFAQLIVQGWTKKLVRSSQDINVLYEKSDATIQYDEPDTEGGKSAIGKLFKITDETGDYFLSARESKIWAPKQPADEIEIDSNLFSESEYTVIIIRTLLDDQEVVVLGLALRKVGSDDARYERVGFINFNRIYEDRFGVFIMGWTQQTVAHMTLINQK